MDGSLYHEQMFDDDVSCSGYMDGDGFCIAARVRPSSRYLLCHLSSGTALLILIVSSPLWLWRVQDVTRSSRLFGCILRDADESQMSVQIMGRGSSGYGGGEGLCLWLGGSSTSETDYNLIYLHDLLAAR